MALNKPLLTEKVYSAPSSSGGYGPPHGGGGGYGPPHGGSGYGTAHVYSSMGHTGYGYHDTGHSHHSKGKEPKKNIALSALTLLAFLFFLHILQSCLDETHHTTTNTTTVVVMAAREQKEHKVNVMKKRKGDDLEDIDEEYKDSNEYIEKKSKSSGSIIRRNWDPKNAKNEKEEKKNVVTTRIKTFTKYDKIDFD